MSHPDMPEYDALRRQLVARRVALGWGQRRLATRLGTTQSAVSDMERGRHAPLISTLRRWAAVLGLRLTMTLSEDGEGGTTGE